MGIPTKALTGMTMHTYKQTHHIKGVAERDFRNALCMVGLIFTNWTTPE